MIEITDAEFSLLKDYLFNTSGIAVPADKRYLFVTRLSDFLGEIGCDNFSQFYVRLTKAEDPELFKRLVEAMTTNETSFYRDGHPFDTLRHMILPELAEQRTGQSRLIRPRLRIWSVGCSTGEEPYTIAMCVHDWLSRQKRYQARDISILAVDLSRRVLNHARRAIYEPGRAKKRLPFGFAERYFTVTDDGLEVNKEVRSMVFFSETNLADPLDILGTFDLIFCRNVIIYFAPKLKVRILEDFHRMLNPGGVMMLGASESIYKLSTRFEPVQNQATTYYRKKEQTSG